MEEGGGRRGCLSPYLLNSNFFFLNYQVAVTTGRMPQFGKILMRFVDVRKPPDKGKVFELLQGELRVPLTGLKEIKSGYNAFTEMEEDVEQLLTDDARTKLRALGLEVKLPPKVKANRAVICRQIDPFVGERTRDDIQHEIERCNSNLKIAELVKFGQHSHVFKIEFRTSEMAQHVLERGFLCFNMKITPSQIQREEFVDVLTCFRCYRMDNHATKDCPTPDLVVCSECTGGHSFRDCKSNQKKCINCGGEHRTMAMACPKKKEIIKKKKEEKKTAEKQKTGSTYAEIVKETLKTVAEQKQSTEIKETTAEAGLRAMIIVMDAHLHNVITPGSYNARINAVMKENNIAPIKFPEIENSQELFNSDTLAKTMNALHSLRRKDSGTTSSSSSSTSSENEEINTQEEEILENHAKAVGDEIRPAADYQIEIVLPEGHVEKKNLTSTELRTMYREAKLKFMILSSSKFSAEQIIHLIMQGKISETEDRIKYVTTAEFKRTKMGATKQEPRKARNPPKP